MAFSRATEDLVPNCKREENGVRDDKGDLNVEGARPGKYAASIQDTANALVVHDSVIYGPRSTQCGARFAIRVLWQLYITVLRENLSTTQCQQYLHAKSQQIVEAMLHHTQFLSSKIIGRKQILAEIQAIQEIY